MLVQPQTMIMLFFLMMLLLAIAFPSLYIVSNWREIQSIRKANCLLWKHPENTNESIAKLELVNIENPPGQSWPFKSFFFLSEKPLKWCYEVKEGTEDKPVFRIYPFNPDEFIDKTGRTSASLASAVDWEWCKPILGRTSPFMEKVAQGGIIIMGCVALFGIFALLDMLGQGG